MKTKTEYREGPGALENFKAGMKKLFQAPKPTEKPVPKKKPKKTG